MPKSQNICSAFLVSIRIFFEFFFGFLFIRNYKKSVSFFGSAREQLPQECYNDAEEISARLANKGFVVITGGSGGIMKAGNKGAWRANKESIGVTISLLNEQIDNNFLTRSKNFKFFFTRKTILSCASELYIFFPGGFGTLDELFEMLTLIQTGHSQKIPILLYGKDFWKPLMTYIDESLCQKYKTISPEDRNLVKLFNSINEMEAYIDSLNLDSRICNIGSRRLE